MSTLCQTYLTPFLALNRIMTTLTMNWSMQAGRCSALVLLVVGLRQVVRIKWCCELMILNSSDLRYVSSDDGYSLCSEPISHDEAKSMLQVVEQQPALTRITRFHVVHCEM